MSLLFSPISFGPLQLPNRIVIAPMCQYSAHDGCVSDWHHIHLGNLALSGAGLLVLEATAVEPRGRISHADLGLWTETCKFDTGLWAVTYDAANNLFALRVNDGEPYTVLQEFRAPGGPTALLASLKTQGLILDDDQCQMAQVTDQPAPEGWTAWQVVPTGKLKAAFQLFWVP